MRSAAICGLLLVGCLSQAPPRFSEAAVELPLAIDGNLPAVELEVGTRRVPVVLDLGGFDTVALRPDLVKEVGATYTGASKTQGRAFGGVVRSREYELPEVRLGSLVLKKVRGYEALNDRADLPQAFRNGYVGLGILRDTCLIIDYRASKVVMSRAFVDSAEYAVSRWPHSTVRVGGDGVVSRMTLDGVERIVVWDTGFTYSVLRPRLAPPPRVEKRGRQGFYTPDSVRLDGVELGPLEFVLVDFQQPEVDGVVGYNFFRDHVVCFDLPRGVVAWKRQ
ncbi:MAG: hypothetical protein HYY16_02740 [Planctomycetes bacterium]|nr:hypothetical protein [Planctomycetota bacterium]